MDDDDDTIEFLILYWLMRQKRRAVVTPRRHRRWWVHQILQKRRKYGEYHRLVGELSLDGERFRQYFRMSREQFQDILTLVEPEITKMTTNMRETISARQRFAICIRFLATGDSYKSLAFSYRVSSSLIGQIVPEVCHALWRILQPLYMKMPEDQADWKQLATNFKLRWDFPHCIGALDGKHVTIQAPDKSGSQYFNYKGTFSVVLMALVDAGCRFITVDVGGYGRNSDGGLFGRSNFGKALKEERLQIPPPEPLQNAPELGDIPYVIVGDEAFPLTTNLMRPYPVGRRAITQQQMIFKGTV